ncbi:slit homolog 1 protein-like [Pocillopora verrucosa]|uniref:slit homolog 1 protein-like n=1 Tax=Pocillopora verrucosa TaxID=203993 RepID=UPI003340E83D
MGGAGATGEGIKDSALRCSTTEPQRLYVNPTLDQAPKTQYVFLNRTSNLWCPVKGAPAPYIVWRKDGVAAQNSTSITFRLKVTSENNVNYSCEVRKDGEVLKRDISLRIEECPGPCECGVFHQTIVSVNCGGKSFNSIAWKFPPAVSKLNISNNQLKELPSGIFSNNTKLSFLNISNNQLKELPSGIFSNNTKLYYL